MTYREKLLCFNSLILLNKREILESFDDFMLHTAQQDKRQVLLPLCEQFRSLLLLKNIPDLTKHWLFYDYSITSDSIRLDLCKCEDVEFDTNNEISTFSVTVEYTLLEVKCDYLTVEQYARQHGVTDTTVRQWIRRGKLRTAKKAGRDWHIPALADKPAYGFRSVDYYWDILPSEITAEFTFLAGCVGVHISRDANNKRVFVCTARMRNSDGKRTVGLDAKARERLELLLIGSAQVTVQESDVAARFVPYKRSTVLPVLSNKPSADEASMPYAVIIVRTNAAPVLYLHTDSPVGGFMKDEYPEPYLLPLYWEFYGAPDSDGDDFLNALGNSDYTGFKRIGCLSGHLLQCTRMIADGYHPLQVCDDESGDLSFIMQTLSKDGAPLNERTGEPLQDILYIHELIVEDGLRGQGLGTRLLQELPYFCKRLVNVFPDILVYYITPFLRKPGASLRVNARLFKFYSDNGFMPLDDNNVLYAFTDTATSRPPARRIARFYCDTN